MSYTNSPLVEYTRLSPNCTKPRNHKIDIITPHIIAGDISIEALGRIFASPARKASSNYGIDSKGRIGLYCNESDRSWCSSNAANDHRAITIEIANTVNQEPYPITDAAMKALIELCADICKRNGIPRLLWRADKSLIGQVDKQNITVHRWFAPKSCPGNYVYDRLGYIADRVNKILGADGLPIEIKKPLPKPYQQTVKEYGDPAELIWDFLKSKGLNDFAVAGIMGNLQAESGLSSINLQNNYEKKFRLNDIQYTNAVDNGEYTNFVKDKAGYGLAQWTYWSRKENLLNFAKEKNTSIGDLKMQLEFLWKEFSANKKLITLFKAASSVRIASDIMLKEFERPADMGTKVQEIRALYGMKFYNRFANKANVFPDTPKLEEKVVEEKIPEKSIAEKIEEMRPKFDVDKEIKEAFGPKKHSKIGEFLIRIFMAIFNAIFNRKNLSKATQTILPTEKIVETPKQLEVKKEIPVPYERPVDMPPAPSPYTSKDFQEYKVKIMQELNYRKEPGVKNKALGTLKKNEIFTIIDETMVGVSKWGKLKSGAGWINLSYTKKI